MKVILFIAAAALCVSFAATGQEREDHELIKNGEPVTGMSVQQGDKSAEVKVPREDDQEVTRVPLLQESTLDDEELDSWRAGDMFGTSDFTERTTRMDTVRRVMNPVRDGSPNP